MEYDGEDEMLKRVITGAIFIACILPVLIFSHTWAFPIAIATISVICLFEMIRCMGMHKHIAMTAPLYIFAVAFPILQRVFTGSDKFYIVGGIALISVVAYVAYLFAWVIFSRGKIAYPDVCTLFLTAIYLLFSMNMVLYIRDYKDGQYLYVLILIGSCVTDIFAYFVGRLFGKHKLAPDVSPKKTIEGSIGGIIFCTVGFVVTGLIVGAIDPETSPNYLYLAISGVIISVISQSGDLIMSVIKRHYKIKDFGKILPGHGGMLDRMDSLLAAAPGVELLIIFSFLTGISLF